MWKNGSTARTTSSGCSAITDIDCSMLATRLRWVSMTPLALPVVPEEYGSTARWVAGSMDDVRRAAALRQQVHHRLVALGAVEHDDLLGAQTDLGAPGHRARQQQRRR